jgi:ribosomal protein S12 methylthiotransferase
VGYPGETEAEFNELLDFVREGRFSHVGVFLYSREPKTPSAQLEDNVPLDEKKRRRDALMRAQLDVSRRRLQARVGEVVDIMCDGALAPGTSAPRGCQAVGRSRLEAPEVDGVVFLRGRAPRGLEPGAILRARVVEGLDYDTVAEVV